MELLWLLLKWLALDLLDTPRTQRIYSHHERYECLEAPEDDVALTEWLTAVPGIRHVRVSRLPSEGLFRTPGSWLVVEYLSKGEARVPFDQFMNALARFGYMMGQRFYVHGTRVAK
jgi:hypothetical protein